MEDRDVQADIQGLAHREHELRELESQGTLGEAEREELAKIEVELDRCWDLLRQRRARATAGLDPDEAQERDPKTVEHYRQ
jgi:Protein of unknown function (DUF2630)